MSNVAHHNNFNLMRLLFASLVVLSHSYALLGNAEPTLWGRTLGNLSVHGFFVISGYLISQSFVGSANVLAFTTYRFLRIIPGLVVALIVTRIVANLCGGFKVNPVPYIANGPVWTLTWEVLCYFALAMLGLIGALRNSSFSGFFAAAWLVYLVNISSTSDSYLVIAPLAMMFLAGTFIYVMEEQINFGKFPWFAVIALAAMSSFGVFQYIYNGVASNVPFLWGPSISAEQAARILYLAVFPVVVIYVGKYVKPVLMVSNDISYGVYIYGWPIAQVLAYAAVQHRVTLSPALYFLLTMAITIPVAFLSWKAVEKPALSLKKKLFVNKPRTA